MGRQCVTGLFVLLPTETCRLSLLFVLFTFIWLLVVSLRGVCKPGLLDGALGVTLNSVTE